MKLLWPYALILLLLIPLLVAGYSWMLRRRRRYAVRFSSLSLIREALPAQSRLRRYLPLVLLLLALASLVFTVARPMATTLVPSGRATVMLVLDVSRSMLQTDIQPTRFDSAKEAALDFIARQQANNQIGIVAFAGIAQLVQAPTTDADDLRMAVLSLTTGRGTAIGRGILEGLDTIAELNASVAASTAGGNEDPQVTPVPEGQYAPDIIVMLTDGVSTTGPDPLFAAQQAADRGVRVFTIGYGTENGAEIQGNQFGGKFFRRGIDEESLKAIAAMTGGEYYSASSASELQKVFKELPTYLNTREETVEISVIFAGLGALLLAAAVLLGQLWHPLP